MQPRKSPFALNMVKSVAAMFVLLSAIGAFAGTETTYTEKTVYSFGTNYPDGIQPLYEGMVMDKAGNLYGVIAHDTDSSGPGYGPGAVFELTLNGSGGWTETILHFFLAGSTSNPDEGQYPYGNLAIDSKGNLYGTTSAGGANGTGTVWKLSPPTVAGNPWTETTLYSFGTAGSGDGYSPLAGVTLASSAATVLYGTTQCGGSGPPTPPGAPPCVGYGPGTVYQLKYVTKTKTVPAHWTETILHSFSGPDGSAPVGSLLLSGGNLYGYAPGGANEHTDCYQCGVVFELQHGAGGWTENVLYNFGATTIDAWFNDFGAHGAPVMDSKKNIYGATDGGGTYGDGAVWELVYSIATNTYTEKVLYSFNTNSQLTAGPLWGLIYSGGHLFGATTGWDYENGSGDGIVFELTYTKPTAKAPGGWQETEIYDFSGSAGNGPGWNQLIKDSSGNLYGMLPGGNGHFGSVFELEQ